MLFFKNCCATLPFAWGSNRKGVCNPDKILKLGEGRGDNNLR